MSRWRVPVAAFFLAAGLARGEGQSGRPADEIVGTWSGSSVCVDRQAAPACKDEQVIYDIRANPGKPNMVTVKGDKVVDGKRLFMGDLEFTHDATTGSWTSELGAPQVHGLWRLKVDGAVMTGTLTQIPSKAVVRKIELRKRDAADVRSPR